MGDTNTGVAPQAAQAQQEHQVSLGENIQLGTQNQIPQAQSNYVPYDRFAQVIAERNELKQALQSGQVRPELQRFTQVQQTPQGIQPQSIGTVDDLLTAVSQMVENKLSQTYESRIKPVEEYVYRTQHGANLERYFSDPARSSVRQEMEAYYRQLDPQSQQFIDAQVLRGNTNWLDTIHAQVLSQKGMVAQQQATQSVQGMANVAQQPQPFRVIRQGEPTFEDIKQNALQTGNFKDVFKAISPK